MTTEHEPTETPDSTDTDTAALENPEQPTETEQTQPGSETSDTEHVAPDAETQAPQPVHTDTAAEQPYELSSESRNWATFAHLSAFVMFLGIPSLLGPLVVWLAKKDDPYVEAQAKEALNFNISMLIYAIVAGISILLVIGIIALPVVFIAWFVLVIVAAIRSADGEQYRYPFTIRLVS